MSRVGKLLYVLAILSLLSFAVIWFIIRDWVPWLTVSLVLAVVFVGAAIFMDRAFYKDFLTMKTTKNGMSMGAMIALVFVLLVAVNFISVRKYKTFDFSAAKINSISEQSVQVLDGLKDDLKVTYFYKGGTEGLDERRRAFNELIKKYQDKSSKIKLDFVELNSRPDLAQEYGVISGVESVYIDYQKNRTKIEKIEEQELTSGIVKATRETQKNVYFMSGHGEYPTEPSQDGQSMALLKQLLEGNRYVVKTFTFNQTTQIPTDADMLFVISPKQNFLESEIKALEDYLKRGGSLVIALDPFAKTGLTAWLKKLGIQYHDGYVITATQTPMGLAIDPRAVRGNEFGTHQITKPFGRNETTVFRMPGYFAREKTPETLAVEDVVRTNANSMFFETPKFDKPGPKGPFTLAMAAKGKYPGEANAPEFNMVVFSGSIIFSDQLLYQSLNRDLVLNTAAFLAKEENLISISPKEIGGTKLELNNTKFAFFLFGVAIPLPIILFLTSGGLWYRRRYS